MSILTIYQTHLTPERNALVDELDWYLENEAIQTFKFEEFQYQKLGEALTLTIRADQSDITNQRVGNYLTITQDGKTWYYFIMSYVWTAANAITLYTVIDSVNTFRNDVEWSRKTTIARQHEDRFSITENASLVRKIDIMSEGIETNKYIVEDTKLQQSADELDWFLVYRTQNDAGIAAEENIPFDTFLCASQPLAIDLQGTPTAATPITAATLEDNYEAILNKDNSIAVLSLPSHVAYDRYEMRDLRVNDRILLVGYYPVPLQGRTYVGFEILVKNILLHKQDNGKIGWYINWSDPILKYLGTEYYMTMDIENIPYDFSDTNYFVLNLPYDYYPDKIENNNNESLYDRRCGEEDSILVKALGSTRIVSDDLPIEEIIAGNLPKHEYEIGSFATVSINSFEDIDRTVKPIMKVLRLPYAPITIQYQDGRYIVPSSWEASTFSQFEGNSLTLLKLKKEFFTDGFLSEVGSINLNNYLSYFPTVEEKLSNSPRNIAAESKLFSSEFLTLKFLYDSFSTAINLEQFQPNGGIYAQEWTLPIRYKQTNTTSSTFLFDLGFDKLYLSNPSVNLEYRRFNDYEQYLVVSRNNEEGLYQSDYLDYMRYGYNFDKKNTEQEVAKGWISAIFAGGAAAGQAGILGTKANWQRIYEKNNPASQFDEFVAKNLPNDSASKAKFKLGKFDTGSIFLVGQAIQAGAQAISGIINQSIATEQAYASLRQKQFELQQQDIGVQGADDIDLLKYYNDNRLHFIVYDTVDLQKEAAHNLFHYCGYSRAKQAIPNFTGRYWFNFIQCSPMFKSEELHPYNDFLDNIKARYENGITVYHRHYNAAGAGQSYDWEQEFENWEDNVVYEKYTTDMLTFFGTTMRQRLTYKGPEIDNYYAWIEVEDADGNSLLNTKDTEGNITYGQEWSFTGAARVRINTRQPEQASDWLTIGG